MLGRLAVDVRGESGLIGLRVLHWHGSVAIIKSCTLQLHDLIKA